MGSDATVLTFLCANSHGPPHSAIPIGAIGNQPMSMVPYRSRKGIAQRLHPHIVIIRRNRHLQHCGRSG